MKEKEKFPKQQQKNVFLEMQQKHKQCLINVLQKKNEYLGYKIKYE
jgi:hypothetical protein